MKPVFPRRLAIAALLLGALLPAAQSQDYPSRPIRIVSGFPAGGQTDIVARIIAQSLNLGQPAVVETRLGGNGIVSLAYVAKAAPDGHTLVVSNAGLLTIEGSVNPELPYNTLRDFAPVIAFAGSPIIFEVSTKLPVKTVAEFIALAKARPGGLNLAGIGGANIPNLVTEQFRLRTGVRWNTVSYKGAGTRIADLISGQVDFTFDNLASSLQYLKAGQFRPLAISKSSAALPGVPTLKEVGIDVDDAIAWHGVLAPAGTPPAIVQKLNAEITRILKSPDTAKRLQELALDPVGGSTRDFDTLIRAESVRWGKVIKEAGLSFKAPQ